MDSHELGKHDIRPDGSNGCDQELTADKPTEYGSSVRSGDSPSPKTVRRHIWDDPDKPEHEKKFLLKLDAYLLSYTCLGYFCKNLDQAKINNAYVSGMKEALHMNGSELTYASDVFTAGYVISQLPTVILVSKLRPSYVIPTLVVFWAVFTFTSAAIKTVPQLYAMRFLVGLCEGAFFPCITYLIASWYKKDERAKRVTLFYSTASLSAMFSGYLQAGVYRGLGRPGWQWLFLVCGAISLPVGVLGYFFNPHFPETTRAFYLTADEAAYASRGLVADGYRPLGAAAWDRGKLFRIHPNGQPFMALWLKSEGESIYRINMLPTGQAAVGFVTQIAVGMLSDSPLLRGRGLKALVALQAGSVVACIILAVWDVHSKGLKYFAMYLAYTSSGVPGIYYSWFPDLMPDDHEMRGFLTAFSNVFSYANNIWWTNRLWWTADAPRVHAALVASAVMGVVLVLTACLMQFLQGRDARMRADKNKSEEEEEANTRTERGGALPSLKNQKGCKISWMYKGLSNPQSESVGAHKHMAKWLL
ncbi:MFS general substrate transporter [Apiospora phragmitis]|uniref:MFS general substrate transporter n=1 Tax=Apiospora phragmitis TaxID=2905665 RepID=A0ABR1VQF7_9PEZI